MVLSGDSVLPSLMDLIPNNVQEIIVPIKDKSRIHTDNSSDIIHFFLRTKAVSKTAKKSIDKALRKVVFFMFPPAHSGTYFGKP